MLIEYFAIAVVSYILGSFSSSYFLLKTLYGIDPREFGSKNAGTLNTWRITKNPIITANVLLLDALKGMLAIIIAKSLVNTPLAMYLAAFFAVAGHNWPWYLGFKGGRGLATMYGILLLVEPFSLVITAITWLVVYIATGYVILGAILAIPTVAAYYYATTGSLPAAIAGSGFAALLGLSKKFVNVMEGKERKHFWSVPKEEERSIRSLLQREP